MIDAIERASEVWNETDHGIWEIREKQQHFVHSKLMCWQALEGGIALADRLGVPDRRSRRSARKLGEGNLIRRYADDGLEGVEGTFVICSFWLAEAQAIIGDVDAARETFENTVASANDVGLLSEEIDVASGELLGNFPQAFSHVGLINAAAGIDAASKLREARA